MSHNKSKITLREKLVDLLSSDSRQREEMLARLTSDECKAYLHQRWIVPSMARIDPNNIPDPPFSEPMMRKLLESASDKIIFWVLNTDEPTIFNDSN